MLGRARWIVFLALGLALQAAAPVSAQPGGANLGARLEAYQAAEGCPAQTMFEVAVERLLGRDPFRGTHAAILSMRVHLAAGDGSDFVGVLRWGEAAEKGRREFRAPSCADLVEAIALAVAIALDPLATASGPVSDRAPAPADAPVPAPADAPVPAPADAPVPAPADAPVPAPASRAWRFSLAAESLVLHGAAPNLALGAGLGVELRYQQFSAMIHVLLGTREDKALEVGRVDARLSLVSLSPCVRLAWLGGCAVASLGGLRGRGHEPLQEAREVLRPYAAMGAGAFAEWFIDRAISLRLRGQAQLGILRTRLTVGGMSAWITPRWLLDAGLAVHFHF